MLSGNTTNPILSGNTVSQGPQLPVPPALLTTLLGPPTGRNQSTVCRAPGWVLWQSLPVREPYPARPLLPAQPHRLRMEVRRSNYQCSPASSARHHRVEAARRRTQFLPGAVPRDKAGVQFLEDQGGAEASDRGYYSSSLDRYPKQSNDQRPKPEPNQCAKAENRRKNNEHTHFA
jgi:hypothetical protein